jgi:glycerol-3-phosphate dehydrogenase
MRHIQTDVLVIGGGATGTGILRDLAMRGYKCLLLERRDLAYGTTGRYHGLLHSGARYAVKDLTAAMECIVENRILRHIMPQCIEDTGGFFILTPFDNPDYIPLFIEGCRKAGIPAEPVSINQMMKEEPLLNPKILQCFRVPDASADSFLACDLNVESARQHGAAFLTYHEVSQLILSKNSSKNNLMVTGVLCHDLVKNEDVHVDASMVVNASGAWAGIIARMAGINLQMLPGKGTMVALNHRLVNTVINRCKLPSDGDILVPTHTVSVMGTTDIQVPDPDFYSIEPWEIRMLLDEGEKIIPQFKQFRVLRAWAGVRPLIQESGSNNNRDISRSFTLLDHSTRDGVDGFISITSGKWTTYRKMAEATVDKISEKLNVTRPCRTHLEMLPLKNELKKHGHYLGARLEKIEVETKYGQLICECELTTWDDVRQSIIQSDTKTLDDIRRDVRLGMGPCQGAFCTIRAAGMLHNLRHPPIEDTNSSLLDFLEERWKGNIPVLWGQQLRQERLNELIYINNLNANYLPRYSNSRLTTDRYLEPANFTSEPTEQLHPLTNQQPTQTDSQSSDVAVIGAGFSGLFTAWSASIAGLKTKNIAKGWGTPYWTTGCIDVLGYKPTDFLQMVDSPANYLDEFIKSFPNHPYALVGLETLENAFHAFLKLAEVHGYPFSGSLDSNILLPTALGAIRPTCFAPISMVAGDLRQTSPMLIVGFDQFFDFSPGLIADNLNAQGFIARNVSLDLLSLKNQKFVTGMVLARLFDQPEFRQDLVDTLKPMLGNIARVGFPAVMGLQNSTEVLKHIELYLGVPVFEIPGLPPSIPGIRIHNMLVSAIEEHHGVINNGMLVSHAQAEGNLISTVITEAAARLVAHRADNYIIASGGILGGGIITFENGYAQETVFDIPISTPNSRIDWFNDQFLSKKGHPIHSIGLHVDNELRPIDDSSRVIYKNLYATGNIIGNCDPIREHSMEGIALATGYKIGQNVARGKF